MTYLLLYVLMVLSTSLALLKFTPIAKNKHEGIFTVTAMAVMPVAIVFGMFIKIYQELKK